VNTRPKNPGKIDEHVKRQERLDEALRENLKKRKQQVRRRAQSDKTNPIDDVPS